MLSAVIVAGGSSSRMGFDKLFAVIAGKPVLAHSISAFDRAECVNEIILVTREESRARVEALVDSENFRSVRVVIGGEHRYDSVRAGLAKVSSKMLHVGVHDAARPLITPNAIARVYEQALKYGGAVLAEPVTDTLKKVALDNLISESVDRSAVWAMQTPQIFARAILQKAYDELARRGTAVTDEVSAVQLIGHRIAVVPIEDANFKITYPRDLAFAERIIASRG